MVFSLRIVNADFYTATPLPGLDPVYSDFRSSKTDKVPVIRIFGSTLNGQKTCLHIHGVFPYICVPYDGGQPTDKYLKQFATSVDFALHVSQGKASSSSRHVHDVEIVTGRSFYGYHEEEQEFMKVSFYNPFIITRAIDLLQNGAVMNKTYQAYESHIPYIQQMFIDYNLYGMNLLNSSSVLFRTPIQLKQDDPAITAMHDDSLHSPTTPVLSPSSNTGSQSNKFWTEETVLSHYRHNEDVERLSICELEVDVKAEHILNQFDIGTSIGTNPGLMAIWKDERQRRKDENDDTALSPPLSQDRGNLPLLEAESKYKEILRQIIAQRDLLMQSQGHHQEPSPATSSQNPYFLRREESSVSTIDDINENTPIVDESIVQEVMESSQRSFSQGLDNTTDMKMVEILAGLADDQSQSRTSQSVLPDPELPSDDEQVEAEDEAHEDEDSIVMSQQVWDDTDPADPQCSGNNDKDVNDDKDDNHDNNDNDDNDENDDKKDDNNDKDDHDDNDSGDQTGCQGSQFRFSQFDFEGLDDTWEVSLLSEDPIPQLDGTNDDMEDTASKSNVPSKSLRKKPLFKKSLYSTRGRKPVEDTTATKESFFQSPSVSQSKEVEEKKNEKQRTTRRLGISSMRLTKRLRRSDNIDNLVEKEETSATERSFDNRKASVQSTFKSQGQTSSFSAKETKDKFAQVGEKKETSNNERLIVGRKKYLPSASKPVDQTFLAFTSKETDNKSAKFKLGEKVDDSLFSLYLSDASTSEEEEEEERDNSKGLQDLSSNAEKSQDNTEIQTAGQKVDIKSFDNPEVKITHVNDLEIPKVRVENLKQGDTMCFPSTSTAYSTDAKSSKMAQIEDFDIPKVKYEEKRKYERDKQSKMIGKPYKDIKRLVFAEYKVSSNVRKAEKKMKPGHLVDRKVTKKNVLYSVKSENNDSTDGHFSMEMSSKKRRNAEEPVVEFSEPTTPDQTREIQMKPCDSGFSEDPAAPKNQKMSTKATPHVTVTYNYKYETRRHTYSFRHIDRHGKTEETSYPKTLTETHDTEPPEEVDYKVPLTKRISSDERNKAIHQSENPSANDCERQCHAIKDLKVVLSDVANIKAQRHLFAAALDRWKGLETNKPEVPKVLSQDTASFSSSPKSSFMPSLTTSFFKCPRKKSTTPRKSPKGKRYGVLDVTVHSSPPPKPVNASPPAVSKKTGKPSSKRNILTQIEKSSSPGKCSRLSGNEIDKLLDGLGSCFSKETAATRDKMSSELIRNEQQEREILQLSTVKKVKLIGETSIDSGSGDCSLSSTETVPISSASNETRQVKRRRYEAAVSSRAKKLPRLSLKLKSKSSSKSSKVSEFPMKDDPDESAVRKDESQERLNHSQTLTSSPSMFDDVFNDSPSILDEIASDDNYSFSEVSQEVQSAVEEECPTYRTTPNQVPQRSNSVLQAEIVESRSKEVSCGSDDHDNAHVLHVTQLEKQSDNINTMSHDVTQEVMTNDDVIKPCGTTETMESNDTQTDDSPIEESQGSLTSGNESDSHAIPDSSPDLFSSALFNMSYLSPERCDEAPSSPPIPCTPSGTTSEDASDPSVLPLDKQVLPIVEFFEQCHPNEDDARISSPAVLSSLATAELSEEFSNKLDSSENGSNLVVGMSQKEDKLEGSAGDTTLRNIEKVKDSHSRSCSSETTVNRTCTTSSASEQENSMSKSISKSSLTTRVPTHRQKILTDISLREHPKNKNVNESVYNKDLENDKNKRPGQVNNKIEHPESHAQTSKQISSLNALHQYCVLKEHTKMVLMGRAEEVLPTVEIEKLSSSGTSGTLSSNKEFVTDVNAELTPSRAIGTPSLDVELSTVTKDELSPSCTSDSERSIKELPPAATEELSPSCTSDTSLSSNNERRPVAKDELSPSVTSETFSSNKELLLNESFETDMHESNHSVRRGSSGGIFLEDERSDTTSNQVNSLEDEEVGYTFNLKRSEEVESSEYKSQLSPLTSSETIDSIHKEDQVGSANLEKSEELFRENSNEEMPVYKENTLPSNESNDIKSSEEESMNYEIQDQLELSPCFDSKQLLSMNESQRHSHGHSRDEGLSSIDAAQSLDNPAIAKSSAEANLQHSSSTLKKCEQDVVIMPQRRAPSSTELTQSLEDHGIPQCRYQQPFYSDSNDVPESTMDIGGRLLKVHSNQVKHLPGFDTRSPFIGLQDWRQLLCANHETSFLKACQENIGTNESFLSGIENNPQLRVAFMGDRSLLITPCRAPPHPSTVRSWAREKLQRKHRDQRNDNDKKGIQSAQVQSEIKENHEDTNVANAKSELSGQDNNSSLGVKSTSNVDHATSDGQNVSGHDPCSEQNPNDPKASKDPGSPVSDLLDHSAGSPPNQVVLTSPDSLFSPVEKTFAFAQMSPSKRDVASSVDYKVEEEPNNRNDAISKDTDHQMSSGDNPDPTVENAIIYQGPPIVREVSIQFQSTPITQSKLKIQHQISSPNHSTPVMNRNLPQLPLLTPIVPSTQDSSSGEKGSSKTRVSEVVPRRQLIPSQLKLCTPDVPLRRRLTEAGSEIEGPSPINTAGYKVPQLNIQDAKANHEVQHLTLLSIELHVRTRKDRRPDPEFDPICAIFYHAQTDSPCPEGNNKVTGIICVDKESAELSRNPGSLSESAESSTDNSLRGKSTLGASACGTGQRQKRPLLIRSGVTQYHVHYIEEEKDIFQAFLFLVRKWDPDVLIGYEIQMLSWGYLIQRALVFDLDLGKLLSRVTGSSSESNVDAEKDTWGAAHTSELKIGGRIILNVWRLMRHEAALNIYTFENVAFHILHERIPLFTFRSLSDWWDHKTDLHRWRTVQHYVTRCHGNIRLLDQVDFIGRTSELARLFGILFFSVISRGSQFRVESMMLRISKPLNYVAISPNVQQRNSMNAPEVIALVLEPESRFYSNPVLVLDFQSLYPSMIIAYNYCYSTCLGRVSCLEDLGEFKFGASTLSLPPMLLKKLEDDIHISPNGVAFVKSNVRLGVLPKMLEDILNTRIMVKNSMKKWKNKKSVCRMLDARQLGLKLIANVTYGYTAAHFSGRMPCVEIGDSIVRKARETLEHAIQVVNNTRKWGAKVVYGDTDSMFVLLDGVSKDEAFKIGKEITETITAMNPKPVRLKFEKVYLPCVLQTKKRYVGYMYETPDQKEPVFDAKGIETVRRDTCPAVAKVLEKSLRLIFETKDVSLVKRYVQRQFRKVMEGRISLHDLTFAKEYRGMSSYKPAACVPALELARQMLKGDRRSEPRVGERVPYVIVYGSPGLPLIRLVRRPLEVLQDASLRVNALYYITKQLIPPLNRAFSLMGVDVKTWFANVPRITRVRVQPFTVSDTRKKTISHYFSTTSCPVCQQTTTRGLCDTCSDDPQKVVVTINNQIRQHERRHVHLTQICYQCCGSRDTKLCCVSLDCPVFHKLVKATRDLDPSQYLRQLVADLLI